MNKELIPYESIENKIFLIRGHKVMLDKDLADLYEVKTKVLNQAVKRNIERFPNSFMFQLTHCEKTELVTICDRFNTLKHSTNLPYVFNEHGILMLSSVLNSKRAVQVNIRIIEVFTKLRKMFIGYKELKDKIDKMESKYDGQFQEVFNAFKKLIEPNDDKKSKKIGFT